ncbi:TetR/AcrR family transcriptional regulator [Streptomyces sp. NPDC059255]|uniref:TetR/AcrR family transcriptional regulator n=1 Tax=Streptomyces sp. NPDC059255 TaxID=3346793 RepID=UPI0036A9BB90
MTSPAADDARPLRSDAERKRRRILHAAREEFAENGLGATLDDVARRAGVGVGTAYRRFGNKQVLINELFEERLDAMVTLAEEVLVEDDPWEGFVRFLTTALERMAGDRGLREVIFSEMHGRPEVAEARRRLLPAAAAVMRRAQDAGALRPDLAATDLPLIQYMVSHTIHYTQPVSADVWKRCLTVVLDGLRARPDGTPMTQAALTPAEEERVVGLGTSMS